MINELETSSFSTYETSLRMIYTRDTNRYQPTTTRASSTKMLYRGYRCRACAVSPSVDRRTLYICRCNWGLEDSRTRCVRRRRRVVCPVIRDGRVATGLMFWILSSGPFLLTARLHVEWRAEGCVVRLQGSFCQLNRANKTRSNPRSFELNRFERDEMIAGVGAIAKTDNTRNVGARVRCTLLLIIKS